MADKRLTVREVNCKVEELSDKFTAGLLEFKKELENKFSVLPTSPSIETDKSELLVKFYTFENCIKQSIAELKSSVKNLSTETDALRQSTEKLWLRYNDSFIILHGLEEKEKDQFGLCENVGSFFNNMLVKKSNDPGNYSITKNSFSQCYRIGTKNSDKPRPVAIQFTRIWLRNWIFYNKRLLKGSGMLITERLNRDRLKLFKQVRSVNKEAWTVNGRIYVSLGNNKRKCVQSIDDIAAQATLDANADDVQGVHD